MNIINWERRVKKIKEKDLWSNICIGPKPETV
jgi:hypothetical protein